MDEKVRMWVMVGVSAAVLLGVVSAVILVEGLNAWTGLMLLTIVALVVVVIALAIRTRMEMRKGFPLQDERSIALTMKAGNRSFYASMYLFLFMAFGFAVLGEDGISLSNAELLFVLVAVMGVIHIILSTYYIWKGRAGRE